MDRLIIRPVGNPGDEMCDLNEAEKYLDFNRGFILLEGQIIHSIQEFMAITARQK